jgi:hypothetical protein
MVNTKDLLSLSHCTSVISVWGSIGVNRSYGGPSAEVGGVASYMTSCHPTSLNITKQTKLHFGGVRASPYAGVL